MNKYNILLNFWEGAFLGGQGDIESELRFNVNHILIYYIK